MQAIPADIIPEIGGAHILHNRAVGDHAGEAGSVGTAVVGTVVGSVVGAVVFIAESPGLPQPVKATGNTQISAKNKHKHFYFIFLCSFSCQFGNILS